jgi:hypothetical protein
MHVAMIVHWRSPYPGREARALEYGAEVNDYWGKLAAEGKCTSPEMFFSTTGLGTWMVKGDRETLEALAASDASQRLLAKGAFLLEDFGWEFHLTGDAADEYMTRYAAVGSELGII